MEFEEKEKRNWELEENFLITSCYVNLFLLIKRYRIKTTILIIDRVTYRLKLPWKCQQ